MITVETRYFKHIFLNLPDFSKIAHGPQRLMLLFIVKILPFLWTLIIKKILFFE